MKAPKRLFRDRPVVEPRPEPVRRVRKGTGHKRMVYTPSGGRGLVVLARPNMNAPPVL